MSCQNSLCFISSWSHLTRSSVDSPVFSLTSRRFSICLRDSVSLSRVHADLLVEGAFDFLQIALEFHVLLGHVLAVLVASA